MEVFDREKDLVEAFSTNTRKFLSRILNKSVSRHFVIEEFDSYLGVADLVLGTYRPYLSKKTLRGSVNRNWIYPLISLRQDEVFRLEDFQIQYGLSKKTSASILNEYVEAGFILELEKGIFIVTREYEFVTGHVVAIEAKLKNWKRALFQAQRYKRFSDFSFVLLDEAYSSAAISNIHEFVSSNIGLVTMGKNGFNVIYTPMEMNLKKEDYLARVNEAAYRCFASAVTA